MKKNILFILIFLFILSSKPDMASAEYTEPYLSEKPYMTLTVTGYGDRDGRVSSSVFREYYDPQSDAAEFTDGFTVSEPGAIVEIVGTEGNVKVETEAAASSTRIKITGRGEASVSIIIRPGVNIIGGAGSDGESGRTSLMFFDKNVSSLPLKRFYVYYRLTQTAVKLNYSLLETYGKGQLYTLKPDINEGVLPSVSWHSAEMTDSGLAVEEMDFLTARIYYTIPDLVRYNRLSWWLILQGLVIIVLGYSQFHLWRKLRQSGSR